MKKFSILYLAFIALIGLNACTSDDDVVFVAQPDPEGISFINSFSESYILTNSTSDNLAERFVWNEVDFDAPTTITYELLGSADAQFTEVSVLGSTSGNNLSATIGDMLELAEDAGLDNDPETEEPNTGQLYFMVRAYAGEGEGNALEEFSEPINLMVELPEAEEEEVETKRELYLVGDATEAGWNPDNNNTPMFRDAENDDVYYFSGYFNIGTVKFVEGTAWAPQYGIDESDNIVPRPTEADPDPAGITIEEAGYYAITVNLADLTYTIEEVDESEAAVFENIGLIGDATPGGWDADTDMTQSEFDPHIWYLENVELGDGFIKFRANDAWDDNWGANTAISGETTSGGPDIPATAGTYNVWFNTLDGRYILIPQTEE